NLGVTASNAVDGGNYVGSAARAATAGGFSIVRTSCGQFFNRSAVDISGKVRRRQQRNVGNVADTCRRQWNRESLLPVGLRETGDAVGEVGSLDRAIARAAATGN